MQRLHEPDDPARFASVRERLLAARALRPQPARDDKVVTAWNGLAIAALAEHGVLTGADGSVAAARRAAELIAGTHWVDGRLRRASRDGVVGRHAGVLEDYGDLAEGLLALHQATGEGRWLELAGDLLDVVGEQFIDSDGWHDTAADAEALVHRPFDPADGPTPAGIAAAAGAAGGLRRAGRLAAAPGARRGGARVPGPAGHPGSPRRRVGRRGGGGAAGRPAGGGGERSGGGGTGRARGGGTRGHQPGRGRRRRRTGRAGGAPAGRPARRGTAGPPRTSAGASSAPRPSATCPL